MSYSPYKQFDLVFKAFENMQKDKYVFFGRIKILEYKNDTLKFHTKKLRIVIYFL